MKLTKPKFWDKRKLSFFSILLLPLTLITSILIFLKRKLSKATEFKIPIICVGNIYIGGTGKTPTSILIGKQLLNHGIKSTILRKKYKNHTDEYNLIKNNFDHLIVNKNRIQGIYEAESKGYEVVILDDGLQDYKIKKNFTILCFHQNQQIGNGCVLPSGPLRENLNALKDINVVLINGDRDLLFEKKILAINKNIEIFYSHYKPENIDRFKNSKLLAIAGIANPENFFELLEKNNLNVEKKMIFPDHYNFSKDEITNIISNAEEKNLKVIMTEKDYYKINKFQLNKIEYLKVSLEVNEKEKLFKIIKKNL
jgi:tetraacyldisaccharide 4'-kinase